MIHSPFGDVVGEVIDFEETGARRRRVGPGLHDEIDVIDGPVGITIDEINQTAADPLDRGYVEFHRPNRPFDFPCTGRAGGAQRVGRILDPKCHGAGARAVVAWELLGKAVGSALTMKLISPCRYRETSFDRCRAMRLNPMVSNNRPSSAVSGAVYSTNSNPSVARGFVDSLECAAACISRIPGWGDS